MKQQIMNIDGIAIHISRKAVKRLNMRIHAADDFVRLSVPLGLSDQRIEQFLQSQRDWIHRQRLRLQQQTPMETHSFATGEDFYFLGKNYRLSVQATTEKPEVNLRNNTLNIHAHAGATEEQKRSMLEQWCALQMTERLPALIDKWSAVIGVRVNQWRIRKMKTRWGSCNTQTKRICLNLNLIHKPLLCLEYVLVHELVHLLEASHNKRFYALMDKFMPEWPSYKRQLQSAPRAYF